MNLVNTLSAAVETTAAAVEENLGFFAEAKKEIVEIGKAFAERFAKIPEQVSVVVDYLPTALTGFVVVLAMLAIIAVVIIVFSKFMSLSGQKAAKASAAAPAAAESNAAPLPSNTSAGSLELVDVDEKTAAVIMAIVSKESGIPLNRLSFKSIKKSEDK